MKFKQFIMYSLKRGMLLSVSVPLFIASVLATILIVEHYQMYAGANRTSKLKNITASMGTLIHEQQKERGATSVFLSSRGDQFGPQLKAQRALTDQAAQDFVASFEQNGNAANDLVYAMLSDVVETLSDRDAIRQSVDTLFIDTPSALGHYTDHNAQMLSTIAKIGSFASSPKVASKVASLQALLAAKESAGIERAVGSGGFAVGRFDFQRVQFLGRLATRQSDNLARFETFAEDRFKADVAAIAALPETERLAQLRRIAFASFQTGDLQGVTAKEFFDATTVRIEGFKAAEDRLTESLSMTVKNVAQSALTSVILLATAALLSAAVSISITAYVVRNMLVGVRNIADAADRLAKGDETAELPKENPTELGRIVWSINFFKESVAKAKEREAKEARERQEMEAAARNEEQQRQAEEKERAEQEAVKAREEQTQMTLYVTEVSEIVAACAMGDFSRKLSLEGREGVFKEIGEGLNTLVESVESGLSAAGQSLEKVANGDLTALMEGDFQGAFKDLQRNTNDMISALKSLIVDINGSTVNLSASSDELRDTSDALSKQAEQNAASLEETSAALEELTASIKQVSENVLEANNNASNASETAESSSVVASEAADAMNRIADASSEISNVVNVINDIAFQINLLALNAGVEAARAGEAGRGFSVVASEVRQLAQRAGEASTEIGSVITRSDQAVAEGVKKVNNAQVSLDMISESVIGVSQRIEEISTAISEQVNGIAEINSAVAQIDTNTQKQAASFEEVTATSALLSNEADGLKQSTARFKTGSDVIALPEKRLASTNEPSPAPKPMVRPAVTTSNLAEELDGWEEF